MEQQTIFNLSLPKQLQCSLEQKAQELGFETSELMKVLAESIVDGSLVMQFVVSRTPATGWRK